MVLKIDRLKFTQTKRNKKILLFEKRHIPEKYIK